MNAIKGLAAVAVVGAMVTGSLGSRALAADVANAKAVERGRYLVTVGGCNDCHTPGFMQEGLKVPEQDRLTGLPVGFQGPWGTTYPANLRLIVGSISESEWMTRARQQRLPPMPSYVLQTMQDDDLKAVYAYIRSLGVAGAAAPAYVAPGGKVDTPYFVFVPVTDQKQAMAGR